MSRIDDALRRMLRGGNEGTEGADARATTPLDRYTFEHAPRVEPIRSVASPRRDNTEAAPAQAPVFTPPASVTPEDDKLIDVRQLANYLQFVLASIRRRKAIAALAMLLVLGPTFAAVHYWPRTYHVYASLLAQRNDMMASLSNPGRAIPRDADAPTRAAAETVLRHDNLVSLVRETDLLNEWERNRPPILKLKDRVFRYLRGPQSEDDKLDAMVGLLEKRIVVGVGNEGTVSIDIDWPDGRVGYKLVQTALRNFIQARESSETGVIVDSVAILERYERSLENEVNATIAERQAEEARRPRPVTVRARSAFAPAPDRRPQTDYPTAPSVAPELAFKVTRVRSTLEAKRQEIARFEETKRQQLSDLQSRLAAALTIYTEGHPTVTSLRQSIETASHDSPELAALKGDAQSLESEYDGLVASELSAPRKTGDSADRRSPQQQGTTAAAAPEPTRPVESSNSIRPSAPEPVSPVPLESDYSSPTTLRLRLQLSQLGDIRDRLESARIELAASEAGFKYRYSIIRPAQIPKNPSKPNVPMILIAGVLASIVLAIAAAVAFDLLSGRVWAPWQVEREVGAPVLVRMREL